MELRGAAACDRAAGFLSSYCFEVDLVHFPMRHDYNARKRNFNRIENNPPLGLADSSSLENPPCAVPVDAGGHVSVIVLVVLLHPSGSCTRGAGGHKLGSTHRSCVSSSSEPRTDPSRCLANMLQVNNIWTPLVS